MLLKQIAAKQLLGIDPDRMDMVRTTLRVVMINHRAFTIFAELQNGSRSSAKSKITTSQRHVLNLTRAMTKV